ncbi:hypothetical protein BC829DRAFT_397455 [Chytridium lagenaria]|nr:hypothetical protein BC829DRAFT_397455 [Chytridium lagenaria]
MKTLRNAMSKSTAPIVPFFPIVMKDVTFLNDGNPGFKHVVEPSDDDAPLLINFDKYRNLCTVLQRYTLPASEPYDFTPVLTPVLRGLPVLPPAALGASNPYLAASTIPGYGATAARGEAGSGGEGLASGLANVAVVAGFVEGRLRAANVGEKGMQKAWEVAGMVEGEDF